MHQGYLEKEPQEATLPGVFAEPQGGMFYFVALFYFTLS